MEREVRIMSWVQIFFIHKKFILAAERVEFVSGGISCIILRDCWCDIVRAPTEENLKI
jgi:hypothetical protein